MPKGKTDKTEAEAAAEFLKTYGYKKEDETKEQAFARIAVRRVNNAVAAIRMLEPLANKANYEFTDEQVKKITGALVEATNTVHNVFHGIAKPGGGFSL